MADAPRRDCATVLREMKAKIPTELTEFHKDIDWNINDASYKPPEDNLQWIRSAETLQKHLPSLKGQGDWAFEIAALFMAVPVERVRELSAQED